MCQISGQVQKGLIISLESSGEKRETRGILATGCEL